MGLVLALAGGEDWIPAMAGSLHPPFSLFLPEGKEKTGRARSKREKEVSPLRGDERRRRARRASVFLNVSSPRRGASGGFGGRRMDCPVLLAAANLAVDCGAWPPGQAIPPGTALLPIGPPQGQTPRQPSGILFPLQLNPAMLGLIGLYGVPD